MSAVQSVLQSVKLYCLVPEETTIYDAQMITLINAQLNTVKELGVGPTAGCYIEGAEETWSILGVSEPLLSAIKLFVKISVKLVFDPPSNSYLVTLLEKQRDEAVWRITNDYSCTESSDE